MTLKTIIYLFILLMGGTIFIDFTKIFPSFAFFFDIVEQYRLHLLIVACIIVFIYPIARLRISLVFIIILMIFQCNFLFNDIFYSDKNYEGSIVNPQEITILNFNVYDKNHDYHRLDKIIADTLPDIIIMPEGKYGFYEYLKSNFKHKYPFIEHGSYEIILSVFPLTYVSSKKDNYGPNLHVIMNLAEQPIHIFAIHAMSPKNSERILKRNQHILSISNYFLSCCYGQPIIIAGDFNSVPWQHDMRNFISLTGLESLFIFPLRIYGSWPSWLPSVFRLPIDHLFFSSEFTIVDWVRLPDYGSDHLPLLLKLKYMQHKN